MAPRTVDFEIRRSKIPGAGMGLFAKGSIPKGTTIGEYTGKRRKTAPNDTDGGYSFGVNVYDEGRFIRREYIDATNSKGPMRFVNGAKTKAQQKKVNVYALQRGQRIYFRTHRPVAPSEELLIDYGESYWNPSITKDQLDACLAKLLDGL
jgi:SET domain-containing protein